MKKIYNVIVIALGVATFTGCNEGSTPASGSRPVAQPGAAVRPGTAKSQVTPGQSGEQPKPVLISVVQDEIVQQPKTEGLNSTETNSTQSNQTKIDESAVNQDQDDETVPVTTPTEQHNQEIKPEDKPEVSQPTSGWTLENFRNFFGTTAPSAPKATGPKYKIPEGESYFQIYGLNGQMATRSDLDLTNGNIYLHCKDEQGNRQDDDYLLSRAEFDQQKLDGDLVESEDGEITMVVDETVDHEKISVPLSCKTLSRS